MKHAIILVLVCSVTASAQITVDGDGSEWTGALPASENSWLLSGGTAGATSKVNEWIWRDATGDLRTDLSPTLYDILEIRIASDGSNLYFLCKLPPNQTGVPAMLQFSLRRPGSTSAQQNQVGFTETIVPASAAWDYLIVTPGGSAGSSVAVWTPVFSVTNTGAFVQNATTGTLEGSVPWSALGGVPGAAVFLCTFSLYAATTSTQVVDIGGTYSNCLDLATTTAGNTWNVVQSGSLDYVAPIEFLSDNEVLPIQLASFTAVALGADRVRLEWLTLSEVNDFGFYVQRRPAQSSEFQTIPKAFVPGQGTSSMPHHYEYTDECVPPGLWHYRLCQVDLDGSVWYSDPINVELVTGVHSATPETWMLGQNYPNPFNPTTRIGFRIQGSGVSNVRLEVNDLLGREVAVLVNEQKPPGEYTATWDGSGLASGVYVYRLTAGNFTDCRKMVLMR